MNINPMTNQQIHEQIDKVATLENAKEWESEQEKFTFCIDLLGISAHSRKADSAVDKLEARFETLLDSMNDRNAAIPEWVNRLAEREAHSDTMKPLSPLEREWLKDFRTHFEP